MYLTGHFIFRVRKISSVYVDLIKAFNIISYNGLVYRSAYWIISRGKLATI